MMDQSQRPTLYSFRRCPYAMRARMAIVASGVSVSLQEVSLRDKPEAMLVCSPKGEVPVLVLGDESGDTGRPRVIEQSLEIMHWALGQNDPYNWLGVGGHVADELIAHNDKEFKQHLDHYKYAVRFPEHPAEVYRQRGESFLQRLDVRLRDACGLFGDALSLADVAIFPFVRQFAFVDYDWFEAAPYPGLQRWLSEWLASPLFAAAMVKHAPDGRRVPFP